MESYQSNHRFILSVKLKKVIWIPSKRWVRHLGIGVFYGMSFNNELYLPLFIKGLSSGMFGFYSTYNKTIDGSQKEVTNYSDIIGNRRDSMCIRGWGEGENPRFDLWKMYLYTFTNFCLFGHVHSKLKGN